MGKSKLSLSLFCTLIALFVIWKPADANDKCSIGCHGTSGATFLAKFKYNYAVEGVVSVYLTGAGEHETSVKLLGQVSVSSLGNCAHVLKVQELAISGPDGKKYPQPEGLEKPVRFTLQDGRIGSDICAEEGETRRSLNIKRAIISMLQTSTTSRTETDIFGVCPTGVSSSTEGGAVIVYRTRDLSRCGHREHGTSDLVTAVFNPTAEIKSTSILQSKLNMESKLVQGVPEKVSVSEEYLYKPFSIGENGAKAKVNTKLTLTTKTAGADNGNFIEAHTIIFENPHDMLNDQSNLQSALTAIKDTAQVLTNEASSKSAGLFAQLVRIFRSTNKDDLMKVYTQVRGNKLEKRVFIDGLLRTGTGDSIEVTIQVLKSKDLSPLEEKLVYLSFGGAKQVSSDALKSAATLVGSANLPQEVYLGVGALTSTYCRARNCHAGKDEGVVAISNKFASKLNCKAKTKVEEDVVVAVLKGVRNIRHLEDNVIDKLVHCVTDNSVKARVRVAALEAFLAEPCAAKIKQTGIDLMKNHQLDSEIRIKAFLAVIGCPCGGSANEIKNLLETEPSQQVGRFISSTLRHIRSSANPDKILARQHYGLIHTSNRFNIDDRKYSFYREASYNVDTLGIGGNVEQTIIYSQDSFLPRSASFNLTAEIFGHNLNVFEIGGRQGNLDLLMEHFLGPKSALRTKKPQDIYDDLVKRYAEVAENFESKVRGRRSVKSDIDNFDKHVKAESTPYNNEVDMDIYVKLFGTDAVFLSLGDDKGFDYSKIIEEVLTYVNTGVNKAKRFQEEIRSHVLFMDAELAYATSTGLPLKLNLVGSATGRLEVSTNIDVHQILRNPSNAMLNVKLVPSTDIEIAGLFYIDANTVSTGLKVVANLHSSTGGQVFAKILENGQGFDLQIKLPIEKQEIVTASSDLLYFTTEKGQMEKQIPVMTDVNKKEYSGCFDQLAEIVGLTACAEVSVPFAVSGPEAKVSLQKFFARYPLTGAAKVKLVLEKNQLNGFHIKGLVRRDQPHRVSFELLFDAEGSKNRKIGLSGDFVNSIEETSISLKLDSPIKTLHGQVMFFSKSTDYAALVKARVDDVEYFARAGFTVQGNNERKVFIPVLEYHFPSEQGKKSIRVDGQVVKEVQGKIVKYQLHGIKVNLESEKVIDINGEIALLPNGLDGHIKATNGEHNMMLSAFIKDHDGKLEFQNTMNPYVNFKIDLHSEFGEELSHNDIDLRYSGDLKNHQNRVTINQFMKYSSGDLSLFTKNKVHIYALPILVRFDSEIKPKKVDFEVEGQYFDERVLFDLEAETEIKKPGDYSVKMIANVNKNGVEAFAKRDIVSADESNLDNYIIVKNFGKYELSGVVMHKIKSNELNVGAVGHLKISGDRRNEDIKFDIGAIESGDLYSSHAKISQSKGDLVDFLLKIHRGQNLNGQFKLLLKDTIAANGQFKVNDADGKGNGMFIIDFKKTQRKYKGDLKLLLKDPDYNVDMDLFLNFEKDNADKIHFSTNTKDADESFDSKNKIVYAGKKFELNVKGDGELQLEGKFARNVEVILPSERALSFKINREMYTKNRALHGNAELVLKDEVKRGGAASSLSYKAKMSKFVLGMDRIDYEGQLSLMLKDGRNFENTLSLTNLPDHDLEKFAFKSNLTGTLIPRPVSLTITEDETKSDSSHSSKKTKYHLKATYGSDIGFEVNRDGEVAFTEKNAIKTFQRNTVVQIRLPFEKAHDIKASSNIVYADNQSNNHLEYSFSKSLQVNADLYKIDMSGKSGFHAGTHKLMVLLPQVQPFSLDTSYEVEFIDDKKSGLLEVKTNYGKGKTVRVIAKAYAQPNEYSASIMAQAPQAEKLKNLEVSITNKNPSPDSYSSVVVVDADGRVYKSDALVVVSKVNPHIDIKYSSPSQPKPGRIYFKVNALSFNLNKVELDIENVRGRSLVSTAELSFPEDGVVFKMTGDSKELGLNNYKYSLILKDVSGAKQLEIYVENGGKVLAVLSTTLTIKTEGQSIIIEGSGSAKTMDGAPSSVDVRYIRTLLTEGPEQGFETFTNVTVGSSSLHVEMKVTNLKFKNSLVFCQRNDCAKAQLYTRTETLRRATEYILIGNLDLRVLCPLPVVGLRASSKISDKYLPQFSLHVNVNNMEKKYQLHTYLEPENGKISAGVSLTLPKRKMKLEFIVTYPRSKAIPFPMRGHVSVDLGENLVQTNREVHFILDIYATKTAVGFSGQIGLVHPHVFRNIFLTGDISFQLTPENEFRFSIEVSTILPRIGDKTVTFSFNAGPDRLFLYLGPPVMTVIHFDGQKNMTADGHHQAVLTLSVLNGKTVEVRAAAKDFNNFECTVGYKGKTDSQLSITAHFDPEKRFDISADLLLPNEKKNLIYGALYLQNDVVKSDYGVSKDNFKYIVNTVKKEVAALENRANEYVTNTTALVKNSVSEVKDNLILIYKVDSVVIRKILEEMAQEVGFTDISEKLDQIDEFVASTINRIKEVTDSISSLITDISKTVEGDLKKLYPNIASLLDQASDVVENFVDVVSKFLEQHKPEVQELANVVAGIFMDVTHLITVPLMDFFNAVSQISTDVLQKFKDLPTFGLIKEKFQELALPERAFALLSVAFQDIQSVLPTEETKVFVDTVSNYVQKKVRQDNVDDSAELYIIYEKLASAFRSLVPFVQQHLTQIAVPTFLSFNLIPMVDLQGQSAPVLGGVPALNILTQILEGDLPDPIDLIRAYRPRSLNPLEEIPAKLRAVVVNGQHIFTFDGRHLTFPGSCRYVLAHDHVDQNFSLIMELQNGQPKGLLLENKSGNTIELDDNGQVALDGAWQGHPVETDDSYSFRMPDGRVGLGTSYGLKAYCTVKLNVCYFEVSGFYHAKLRGLLGDGNNEGFDDFRLPNGKIVQSEADFGNAYHLSRSCARVRTPEHSSHQHFAPLPTPCAEVFGPDSELKLLQLFQDVAPFRQACINAATGNDADTLQQACDLARGYVTLATTSLLPAVLPTACVQCTDGDKPREFGDTYQLTLPGNQADIVIAVETTKGNEATYRKMVVPLVSQIVDGLKAKHVTDIKVYLLGISPKQPYPYIYDTDEKLKNAKITFDDDGRYETLRQQRIITGFDKLDRAWSNLLTLVDEIKIGLGLTNVVDAYSSISELPLRPGAVKHTVSVVSEPCRGPALLVNFVSAVSYGVVFDNNAYTHSLITITPELAIEGGKRAEDVIGYDSESVLLLYGLETNEDMSTLRETLDIREDGCTDFVELTDGMIFSSTNFAAADADKRREFLDKISANILERMLNKTLKQECVCTYVSPFSFRSVCINDDEEDVPARRRK